MEKISNRALISRLYSAAEEKLEDAKYDIESWSEWYHAVQSLIAPEKIVYIIVKLNQTVTNGGFSEFFESSHGVFAPEIAHVLSEIGAGESADIVLSTLPIVNPTALLDDEYKAFIFKVQLTDNQKAALYNQDIQYDQLQDKENLEDLLGNYLQSMIQL